MYKNASGTSWWTSTPQRNGRSFIINSIGALTFSNINSLLAIRPAIALKSTVKLEGEGTSASPYIVN